MESNFSSLTQVHKDILVKTDKSTFDKMKHEMEATFTIAGGKTFQQ
jgi:hypothetical protein